MFGVIDRFEGEYAVVEMDDGRIENIHISRIPDYAKEGDVIAEHGEVYKIDRLETEKRKQEIEELTKDIWSQQI